MFPSVWQKHTDLPTWASMLLSPNHNQGSTARSSSGTFPSHCILPSGMGRNHILASQLPSQDSSAGLRALTTQLWGRAQVEGAVNVIVHLQLCIHGLLQQVWDLLLLERSLFQDDHSICALSREVNPLEQEWIKSSANTDPALGGQSEVRDHSRHLTVLLPKPPCRSDIHPKINSTFAWNHSKLSTREHRWFFGGAGDVGNDSAHLHLPRCSQVFC